MWVCAHDVNVLRGQRHQITLKLELQEIVSCLTRVLGNKIGRLQKQYAPSTAEAPLQPNNKHFEYIY